MNKPLKTVSYTLDEETEQWIKEEAAARERSASWLIRAIIADYRDRLFVQGPQGPAAAQGPARMENSYGQ
jgi:predicted transcriptional regulator